MMRSQMREFLDDNITFSWPEDPQHRDEYSKFYFQFSKDYTMSHLLRHERNLSTSKSRIGPDASQVVGQYRVRKENLTGMPFYKPFVVKRIQHPPNKYKQTINEVEAMKELRYPHVAAFLGFFRHDAALYIATYPAGSCDLGDFLHCVSVKLEHEGGGDPWRPRDGLPSEETEHLGLFHEPLLCQLKRLEGWFLCLSTALEYLHRSRVRHKDIKPENIIIDTQGAVIIVDFGISTKFEATALNMVTTSQGPPSTSRYAPKEIRGPLRDDRSDLWSMGCVFLEMISPIFGKSTTRCKTHHTTKTHSYGAASTIEEYSEHLEAMKVWFDGLILTDYRLTTDREKVHLALATIRLMLKPEIEGRLSARDLWRKFDLADEKCRDCHPSSDFKWESSLEQKDLHARSQEHREEIMNYQEEQEIMRGRRLSGRFPPLPGSPTRKSFEKISRASDPTLSSHSRPQAARPDGPPNVPESSFKMRRSSFTRGRLPDSDIRNGDASNLDSNAAQPLPSTSSSGVFLKSARSEQRSGSPSGSVLRWHPTKSVRTYDKLDTVLDEGISNDDPALRISSGLGPSHLQRPRPRRASKSHESDAHKPMPDAEPQDRPRSKDGTQPQILGEPIQQKLGVTALPHIAVSGPDSTHNQGQVEPKALTNGLTRVSQSPSETKNETAQMNTKLQSSLHKHPAVTTTQHWDLNVGDQKKEMEGQDTKKSHTWFPKDIWSFNLQKVTDGVSQAPSDAMKCKPSHYVPPCSADRTQ